MSEEPGTDVVDELQGLLEKQVELAREGNLSAVEALSKQTEPLVYKIAQAGILESSRSRTQRQQLQRTYDRLSLAIAAQKADVAGKLSLIRKGKKTIEAYRSNLE